MTQAPALQPSSSCSSPRRSTYKWWVVFMLWFVCFFNYADRQSINSVFPQLQNEFQFNEQQLGLIASAFMWVYALCAPLAGMVGDRVQRKSLILGGCLFWSFITITTGWCSHLWQFVMVRALEGFGETFYIPASLSLVSDYHDRSTRSRAMSFHQSSVYVGTIAGSWFGALFAAHYNWRLGFYLFGGAGMLLAMILFRHLREPRRGQCEAVSEAVSQQRLPLSQTLKIVFRRPTALLLMAAFFGANLVAMVFLTWTTFFLQKKFGFEQATAGFLGILIINLASALSVSVAGAMADRMAQRFAGGRILVQAAGLLVGAGFVTMVARTDNKTTLLVSLAVYGLCKGFYDSGIFASLYDVIEPRARATAAGFMNTVGWAGGAIGAMSFGWLAMHGQHPPQSASASDVLASKVANMSDALAMGSWVYLAAAVILLTTVAVFVRRDLIQFQETV